MVKIFDSFLMTLVSRNFTLLFHLFILEITMQ